jgi:hypothetical protein
VADLISSLIPNLIQGISQQPDSQRDPSQAATQVNAVSSLTDGLTKRPGTKALAKISNTPLGDVFMHSILRDATEKYIAAISKTSIRVFDLDGAEYTVNAPNGYGYFSSVVSAADDISATTVEDTTFITNKRRQVLTYAELWPQPAQLPYQFCVVVRQATYATYYYVEVNGEFAEVQTPTAPVIVSGGVTTEYTISAAEIALELFNALRPLLPSTGPDTILMRLGNNVIWFGSDEPMSIWIEDGRAGADLTWFGPEVQSFTDLPRWCRQNYIVRITGDPSNKYDESYATFRRKVGSVEYTNNYSSMGEGAWEESCAPGIEYAIDEDTMPHLLLRLPSGQFYFGPASGNLYSGYQLPYWLYREAGDYETAPDPQFVNKAISDIFFYKNRLGFLSDEVVTLSRAGDYFNFFPETALEVLDTDPIDLVASSTKVSLLRYAVPYQDEMILFSDEVQFRLGSSDAAPTPASTQVSTLTQYEISPAARPIQAGAGLVFAQPSGEYSVFREFTLRGAGTALVADAQSLTDYCSTYIPNEIFRIAANDTGNAWFAISRQADYENRIYTHKFFYRNQGGGPQRVQSSWSYWELEAVSKILQILCIKEELFLVAEYPNGSVWIEKIQVADRLTDPESPTRPFLLDRRVDNTTNTPSTIRVGAPTYNAGANTTTWTLPYPAQRRVEAWTAVADGQIAGVLVGFAAGGATTLVASGDWRGKTIWFGEQYTMSYVFSRMKYMKEIGGGKVTLNATRTQLRHMKLRFNNSIFFKVIVRAEERPDSVYRMDNTAPDQPKAGVFHVPLLSRSDRCWVEIQNDTPGPCSFSTAEWVGLATSWSRNISS